ncbi:MAG TPA: acetylxylan esterase [Bryobacterales bacterium]|nr:acetylxylan esterase [Bryobacterales bacterium]
MKKTFAVLFLFSAGALPAQTTPESMRLVLAQPLQASAVTDSQLRRYVVRKVPALVRPARAAEWTAEAQRLRKKVLDEVVFHGWPHEWVEAPTRFEDLGYLPAGKGYRLRRLRYEIVPGFQSTALLYEPETLRGRVPAILNVNGHETEGKAMEYIQKRCINQARQGILALNLEWIGMGELAQEENLHWYAAHLDLAGANGLGVFYLAMRRGLDYLWQHPAVDRGRIGITGLSGGGWQTIVLSALDERILAALPDAGYLSARSFGGAELIGDNEQSATDLNAIADYAQFTAMRAPRPTLLIYNEEDSCCFRAPRMKPFLFDPVRPFFELFGKADQLGWYENTDPGDHNYQLDNRMHSYRFFARAFGLRAPEEESPAGADIKSIPELTVGLPKDNLTLPGIARKLASRITRPPLPEPGSAREAWAREQRAKLAQVVRYHPVTVEGAWPMANTYGKGLKTIGYRFDFNNGLSATGAWLETVAESGPQANLHAPWTIILNDAGKKAAGTEVSDGVNRGEQVLAVDPILIGDGATPQYSYPVFDRMLASLGERSLGLEATQLVAIARWIGKTSGQPKGRLEANGPRTQTTALVAAALEPEMFSEIVVRQGMRSLRHLLDAPVDYRKVPEPFCLDLYREFDLDGLALLAAPARTTQIGVARRVYPASTARLPGFSRRPRAL